MADELDGLAAAMGRKVEKIREKMLSNDIMYHIRMSAKNFKSIVMNLDSDFFVVSFYDGSLKKRTIRKLFSNSSTVIIFHSLLPIEPNIDETQKMLEANVRIELTKEECVSIDLDSESIWDSHSLTLFQSILSERFKAIIASTVSEQSQNQSQLAVPVPSISQNKGAVGLRRNQADSLYIYI